LSQYDDENEKPTLRLGEVKSLFEKASTDRSKEDIAERVKLAAENLKKEQEDLDRFGKSDYMTKEEYASAFKKASSKKSSKKKKKTRKRDTESELIEALEAAGPDDESNVGKESLEAASARAEQQALVKASIEESRRAEMKRREEVFGDDGDDDDEELQNAIARTRKLAAVGGSDNMEDKGATVVISALSHLDKSKKAQMDLDGGGESDEKLVFDELGEFVRAVEAAGLETEMKSDAIDEDDELDGNGALEPGGGGDDDMVDDGDEPAEKTAKEEPAEIPRAHAGDDEGGAALPMGLSSALEHFRMLGDLKVKKEFVGRARDKRLGADGEAGGAGKESDARRDVKLQYVDEFGRELTPKEAFRQLCYKFHGRGPSKNTREKRLKKYLNELRLKSKSKSGDTPLSAVAALKKETKKNASPFVVLSGPSALKAEFSVAREKGKKGAGKRSAGDGAQVAAVGEASGDLKRERGERVEIKFGKPPKKPKT